MYYAEFELDEIKGASLILTNLSKYNFPVVLSVHLPQNKFRNYIVTFGNPYEELTINLDDELRTLAVGNRKKYTYKVSLSGGFPFSGKTYQENQASENLDIREPVAENLEDISAENYSLEQELGIMRTNTLPNDIPSYVCCPYTTNGGKVHVQIRDRNCLTGTIYNAWVVLSYKLVLV